MVTGGARGCGSKALRRIAAKKGCPVLGEFSCKGYDTFGPFKLVGGIAKGAPQRTGPGAGAGLLPDTRGNVTGGKTWTGNLRPLA